MLLGLSLLGVILFLTYKWLNSYYNYWGEKNVPHPPTNFFFGNISEAMLMKKSLGEIFADIYNKYTDYLYVGFYRVRTPALVIRDPDLLRTILVKDFSSFHDNDIDADEETDPLFAKNPFAINGERWKPVRTQLTPCFTSGKMKSLYPIMAEVGKKYAEFLERESQTAGENGLEAKESCAKFTTENVISCAFGLDANCFNDDKSFYRELGRRMLSVGLISGIKFMISLVWPSISKFFSLKFVPEEVENDFRNLVNKIIKYRRENNIKRNDFMDNLLEVKDKDPDFNDEDIAAHAIGLFIDGFESSSIVLSHIFYEIAANPDVQLLLQKEIDQLQSKGDVTYETLQGMSYLDAVINESLRLHPPGLALLKRCTKTFTLPPPKPGLEPVTIPAMTPIMVPLLGLHKDEKYFPNPEVFDPERFLGERKNEITKFTFFPFGEGPRACLGQRFALLQLKVAIFNVVKEFDLRVSKKTIQPLQIDPTYFLLAAKGGLWLKYYKRKH